MLHEVIFEPLYKDTEFPTQATENSSCYDVRAYIAGRHITTYPSGVVDPVKVFCKTTILEIAPGEAVIVPLGFKMTLPGNMETQMRPRSSWGLRGLIIPNSPGTIDADYPGEVGVIIRNITEFTQHIYHGERCAQMGFHIYERVAFIPGVVSQTTDRVGGLGSTGK